MAHEIQVLAECEGLTAHRDSVLCRLQAGKIS
jgi:histidinol dehydrogenase